MMVLVLLSAALLTYLVGRLIVRGVWLFFVAAGSRARTCEARRG